MSQQTTAPRIIRDRDEITEPLPALSAWRDAEGRVWTCDGYGRATADDMPMHPERWVVLYYGPIEEVVPDPVREAAPHPAEPTEFAPEPIGLPAAEADAESTLITGRGSHRGARAEESAVAHGTGEHRPHAMRQQTPPGYGLPGMPVEEPTDPTRPPYADPRTGEHLRQEPDARGTAQQLVEDVFGSVPIITGDRRPVLGLPVDEDELSRPLPDGDTGPAPLTQRATRTEHEERQLAAYLADAMGPVVDERIAAHLRPVIARLDRIGRMVGWLCKRVDDLASGPGSHRAPRPARRSLRRLVRIGGAA